MAELEGRYIPTARVVRSPSAPQGQLLSEARSDDGLVKLLIDFPAGPVEAVAIPSGRPDHLLPVLPDRLRPWLQFLRNRPGGPRQKSIGCGDAESGKDLLEKISRDVPPDNLVFMGMGEPMHNLDEVIRAARASRKKEKDSSEADNR